MTIQTNLNDRKELARRLIPFNHNEKLHYTCLLYTSPSPRD